MAAPITSQPTNELGMVRMNPDPGLDKLENILKLTIKLVSPPVITIPCMYQPRKYSITDNDDTKIFFVQEEWDQGCCCKVGSLSLIHI